MIEAVFAKFLNKCNHLPSSRLRSEQSHVGDCQTGQAQQLERLLFIVLARFTKFTFDQFDVTQNAMDDQPDRAQGQ